MKSKAYHSSLANDQIPKFVKTTTSFGNLRQQAFKIQLDVCNLIKERGNTFYKMNDYKLACDIYEELFAFFEFQECQNNKIHLVKYFGINNDEQQQLLSLKITILNNISAAYLKLSMFQETIQTASYVLQIDSKQTKALFRRGKARLSFSSLSDEDLLYSMNDLQAAYDLSPDEFIQNTYLSALKLWNQRQAVVNSANLIKNADLSFEESNFVETLDEIQELREFTEQKGKERVQRLKSQGKVKEANDFLFELNQAQEAKSQLEKISRLDFNKPKPIKLQQQQYLTEIINRLGVNQKQLQLEFKKMQQQHLQDIRNKLAQWKKQHCDSDMSTTNQGNQGEQKQYLSENNIFNLICILIGIILFILVGIVVAGT